MILFCVLNMPASCCAAATAMKHFCKILALCGLHLVLGIGIISAWAGKTPLNGRIVSMVSCPACPEAVPKSSQLVGDFPTAMPKSSQLAKNC